MERSPHTITVTPFPRANDVDCFYNEGWPRGLHLAGSADVVYHYNGNYLHDRRIPYAYSSILRV